MRLKETDEMFHLIVGSTFDDMRLQMARELEWERERRESSAGDRGLRATNRGSPNLNRFCSSFSAFKRVLLMQLFVNDSNKPVRN